MTRPHLINLSIHIGAGTIALALGGVMLARRKGTRDHVRLGRVFAYLTLIVCLSAALGLALFRFLPLFAVITILVLYQLGSGWHAGRTREKGPNALDAVWTAAAVVSSGAVAPRALTDSAAASTSVIQSTFAALGVMLLYDTVRWFFPRHWHRIAWRYEHSYKLIASMFGMLSALVGNVVRVGQPWSQLVPSAVGLMVAAYFFARLYREDSQAVR